MNTSKFQLIFVGVFAAFIVIGVMIFAAGGGKGGSANATNVVIWGDIPQAAFDSIYKASPFSKSKTVTVTYFEKPQKTFNLEFINALAEGKGPDVIIFPSDILMKNRNKLFTVPFKGYSERMYRDTFSEVSEIFLNTEGIFAFPISINPLVMYWNRDILSNAGLVGPPEYWDEFFNLSQKISAKDGAFNISRSTVALGEYANITNAKDILAALFLQAGNPIVSVINGSMVSVLRDDFGLPIPPGQAALSFYTEFSNPAKAYYSWNRSLPESQTMFLSGDLALYFGFASEYKALKIKNPNLNFDVKIFPQSANVRTGGRIMTYGKIEGIAIVKNSKNIEAAFAAVSEFTGKDPSNSFARELSQAPARRDLLSENQSDSASPVFYKSALWSKSWFDPDSEETSTIFKNMVESVTGGRSRLDSAVIQATLQIAELIKK